MIDQTSKKLNDIFSNISGNESTCKGHFYKFKQNFYVGLHGEIVYKQSFVKLKKLSCDGCLDCGGLSEMLTHEVHEGNMIPFPDNLSHGDIVTLTAVNDGRNFEDLYDECHLEFVKHSC